MMLIEQDVTGSEPLFTVSEQVKKVIIKIQKSKEKKKKPSSAQSASSV